MGSDMKSFSPIQRRKMTLKKERENHVSNSADHLLGMPFLLGCVWASGEMKNSTRGEKALNFCIVKFTAVVALKFFNINMKLILDISMKINQNVMDVRFGN